jgi:periplasmic protein TonB
MTRPEKLKGPIVMSALLHVGMLVFVIVGPVVFPFQASENWGMNGIEGDAMKVKMVGSVGIALPTPEVTKEDVPANDSKGFYKSEPATPPPPPEKAEPIPDMSAKTKVTKAPPKPIPPAPPTKAKKAEPDPTPPDNKVPYGEGGKPALSMGQFSTQGGGQMGVGFGDAFGDKYSWYVQAMVRKISQNWLKGLVDSRVERAPKVFMTFDIQRDGTITNVEVKQSSNIPTLDRSAQRALLATKQLDPLPKDYLGSTVKVTFYFEYVK